MKRPDKKQELKRLLKRLARGGKPKFKHGICGNVFLTIGIHLHQIIPDYYRIIKQWPHYSGDSLYPVEGPTKYIFDSYQCTLWTGKSGKLRRSLCRFLAKHLES